MSEQTVSPLSRWRFRPGWLLSIAALLAFVVLCSLGTWQMQRLFWKTELLNQISSRFAEAPMTLTTGPQPSADLGFRPVEARGTLNDDAWQQFGIFKRGRGVGSELLVPFTLDDGSVMAANLGWLPREAFVDGQIAAIVPDEPVTLRGYLRERDYRASSWLTPGAQADNRHFFAYDQNFAAAFGVGDLNPFALVVTEPLAADTPLRVNEPQINLPNNHLQYVVTWFGLALTLIGVYVAFGLQRGRTNA